MASVARALAALPLSSPSDRRQRRQRSHRLSRAAPSASIGDIDANAAAGASQEVVPMPTQPDAAPPPRLRLADAAVAAAARRKAAGLPDRCKLEGTEASHRAEDQRLRKLQN